MKTQNFLHTRLSPRPALPTSGQSSPVWVVGTWPSLLLLLPPVTPGQGLLLPRLLLWVLPVSSPVWTLPPAALASGRRQPRGRNQQLYGHVNYKCRSCYDRGRPGGSARTLLEGAARLQEGLPKGWARAPRMTQRGGSILGGGSRRRSRVCTCPAGGGSLCKVQVFRCGNPSLNSLGGQLRDLN